MEGADEIPKGSLLCLYNPLWVTYFLDSSSEGSCKWACDMSTSEKRFPSERLASNSSTPGSGYIRVCEAGLADCNLIGATDSDFTILFNYWDNRCCQPWGFYWRDNFHSLTQLPLSLLVPVVLCMPWKILELHYCLHLALPLFLAGTPTHCEKIINHSLVRILRDFEFSHAVSLSALASNNAFIIQLVKMWLGGAPHVVVGTLKIRHLKYFFTRKEFSRLLSYHVAVVVSNACLWKQLWF